ncbi:MAG: nicotinamide-nucleotide amidohydrolase family protein [Candidatus Omnitrophica bacterium]|jgi:nicotinamide-nucleotide amidase|nr:nicotinamide-nucleotide amidohydrolase family protein [Candidatus Omnitrophota bacterium]
MEQIIAQVHRILIKSKKTVAVAESCTGGLVSSLLTELSGSSAYFILGVVAYNNKVKTKLLKVPASLIANKGVVSKEVAIKLAQGARKLAKTDFSIGITGIAGPSGSSPFKPVGTVFIAAASKHKILCKKFHFTGNRSAIRKKAALQSLVILKNLL